MNIKRIIQLWLARYLNEPEIPIGKTTGYALARSEKSECILGKESYMIAPYFLHNVKLGDYSYFAFNAHAVNVTVGKFCSIGPNFCCGLGIHPTNGISTSPYFYRGRIEEHKQTNIGNDVFIGANVTVLDGISIGDGAVIGAGAVVVKDIPSYAIAVGVPAKVVKYRFDKKTIEALMEKKWWNGTDEDLKDVERNFWDINTFLTGTE